MERSLAEDIQHTLSEVIPDIETNVEQARRALSDTVVPMMNALVIGLRSGAPRITDLSVDDGQDHARLLFGNRPGSTPERLAPPWYRVSVTPDGELSIAHDASWHGNSGVQAAEPVTSAEAFAKENGLAASLYLFVTNAEVAYRKTVLISGW